MSINIFDLRYSMEIRNLLTFIHVAELNSFTKAGERLGYSQSAVSFQIKQLETELGYPLFDRIGHSITLTDKGKELLSYAHKVTTLTDEFMESIHTADEIQGRIHFVAPDSVCEDMLLNNYLLFRQTYPKIELKFTNADTNAMMVMLDRNEADAVITLDSHNYRQDYVIFEEELVKMHFTVNANSPLAGKKMKIEDLLREPFILTEKNVGYRTGFDRELARRCMEITPVLEVGRTDIILTLLEQTNAVSYLPEYTTAQKVKEGKLAYIEVSDFSTSVWKQLIYHKNKWISNALRAFLNFVKEHEFSEAKEG